MPLFVHCIVVSFSLAGSTLAPLVDGTFEQLEKCWLRDREHDFSEVGSVVLFEEQVERIGQGDVHLELFVVELEIEGE